MLVESGQHVTKGQVILIAENPDMEDRRNSMVANLHKAEFALRQSFSKDPVEIKMAHARADALKEELDRIDEKLRDLTLRSPQDGVVAAGIMKQLTGQYLKHGKVIGMVEDLNRLRVTALVDQASNDALFNVNNKINRVELRTAGKVDRIIPSSVIQAAPAGKQRLPHAALSSGAGGNVSTDPKDQHGMMAMRPQFEFWLNLPQTKTMDVDHTTDPLSMSDLDQYPGQRVYVRFTMEHYRPLLFQWIHMARQVLRDRLSV